MTRNDLLQGRLLSLAAVFLFLSAIGLSISPAVKTRNWEVWILYQHWFGLLTWGVGFASIHAISKKFLPHRDPYLIPITGLLSGWGLMVIWRLYPDLGFKQSLWLILSLGILGLGIRFHNKVFLIRKYKYSWLTASLVLTGLTFIWGTNPMGYGPEMWLGCCGLYLQPSEPLKFMLIAYLAAYLADQQPFLYITSLRPARKKPKGIFGRDSFHAVALLPLLAPTLIMSGMAFLLLIIQQDLGTATIFLLIYAIIIYLATGDNRVIGISILVLLIAFISGFRLFDVVRIRIEAWSNPFLDPSGNSYQIVQSLIALANGEIFGRGLGIGYPNLVPVAHSDFIFTSIIEEYGFLGGFVLFACLMIFFYRGIRSGLRTGDTYRRLLGVGLSVYLIGQSVLIIGGNLRLFPLTGITLPFMSYGGSSLVVSFLSLLFLLLISDKDDQQPAPIIAPKIYRNISAAFLVVIVLASVMLGWWALFQSADLLARTDNPRRTISDTVERRGAIFDRQNHPLTETTGKVGNFQRSINYPSLSNILGYTNPTYGQSGLESSMDGYLRGEQGNPAELIWWNRLLYGFPPPGRDIRTSIDIHMQLKLDGYLKNFIGAGILINAENGEILAISSSPTFDGNQLNSIWEDLVNDPDAPLINRVVQGQYPVGELCDGLFNEFLASGVVNINPQIRLPVGQQGKFQPEAELASPLQIVLISAAISNGGSQPAPLFVTAVNSDPVGWVILPPLDRPNQIMPEFTSISLGRRFSNSDINIWHSTQAIDNAVGGRVTWFVGGTEPGMNSTPFSIVVVLETDDLLAADEIGQSMLLEAIQPGE